ncbi:SDR family oxidoreductase [Sphingomonas turrisvirgatae]|uniref:3-oxoacyl-[acyl-carrier-protein] reductase n=1 Tax=Sphingomonas turrisvirgatae TaxID=1888892 RepID=A0A1E3LXJ5_9SPHN|nr:SDR family NAD(P)-dependent oxidoreductase [Sphingomonas turrisvirgatae]ODP38453.1 3-oxoacyl-[acyl-carrier-protein] reductase [Sphingomonas turrisvirgatae]
MTARLVVVTGAAGVLGRAVCAELLNAGHVVAGIDLAPFADPALALSLSAIDLTDAASVADAFARIEALGALHGLVNVAGGFRWETITEGDVESWDFLYRINLRTALNAVRAALPLLGTGGSIVNVGAAGAIKAGAGMGAYAASKSGVARLTESLAEELKDAGIRVNAVLPSIIDTPVNRADMPNAEFDRWVSPAALAGVIGFLLSDAAAPITGALIPVTGRV